MPDYTDIMLRAFTERFDRASETPWADLPLPVRTAISEALGQTLAQVQEDLY